MMAEEGTGGRAETRLESDIEETLMRLPRLKGVGPGYEAHEGELRRRLALVRTKLEEAMHWAQSFADVADAADAQFREEG